MSINAWYFPASNKCEKQFLNLMFRFASILNKIFVILVTREFVWRKMF